MDFPFSATGWAPGGRTQKKNTRRRPRNTPDIGDGCTATLLCQNPVPHTNARAWSHGCVHSCSFRLATLAHPHTPLAHTASPHAPSLLESPRTRALFAACCASPGEPDAPSTQHSSSTGCSARPTRCARAPVVRVRVPRALLGRSSFGLLGGKAAAVRGHRRRRGVNQVTKNRRTRPRALNPVAFRRTNPQNALRPPPGTRLLAAHATRASSPNSPPRSRGSHDPSV